MKLTFIGNACQLVESNGFRICTDPWLVDGAFGSWYHWPPLRTKPQDVLDVDALFISHLHPDHLDKETLKHFRREIPIVILRHGPNYLLKILMGMGFTNVILCDDRQGYLLGPFRLTLFAPFVGNAFYETAMGNLIDSAILFEADGQKVLSTVDNTPSIEACHKLREEYGPFDVVQLQFNAAGPYPACFNNLTDDEKRSESDKQINRNLDHLIDMARALKPRIVQPFAGAYIIGGKLWELNKCIGTSPNRMGTTTPMIAALALSHERFTPFHPAEGDFIDLSIRKMPVFTLIPIGGLDAYAESTAAIPYPWESDPEQEADWFNEHITKAWLRLRDAQDRFKCWPDCEVRINEWRFSMMSDEDCTASPSENVLACTLDSRLLARILKREEHWNNAEIGCHIEFHRTGPYLPDVHTLLSFFHA